MRLRVLRPAITVQTTVTGLNEFHENIVLYADRGKVLAIEVLVKGICLANGEHDKKQRDVPFFRHIHLFRKRPRGRLDSTNSWPIPSALALVYDDQYNKILMRHHDVTKNATSGLESNQVARLMRSLVVLYDDVKRAAVNWEIGSRRDTLQTSLRAFNEALEALNTMMPAWDQDQFGAYCKLYRNLEHLSEQVVSGRILKVDFTEDDARLLPSTLHTVGKLLQFLDHKDSVDVLVSDAGLYGSLRKMLNAVTLPTERLICSRLIMDLWLLEDWNYEKDV